MGKQVHYYNQLFWWYSFIKIKLINFPNFFLDACKRDLLSALKVYRGLQPESDTFVFNDGRELNLVNLNGTIPVTYKGSTYNIPVCFWLLDNYPTEAPMCYVKPTLDMQIKTGPNVDSTGFISLPYIKEWNYPNSNLSGIIGVCTSAFSSAPPVFTKPSKTLSTTNQSSSSATSTSVSEASALTDEQLKISLKSAVEEKFRHKLSEEFNKTNAELASLHNTNKELLDGQEKINGISRTLEDKISEIEIHKLTLDDRKDKMEKALDELSKDETIDADSIVSVTDPLHRQIVDAYVEDSAADDAIYILGEALRANKIDCESFLKKVRNISRKQFYHRAIMDKCRTLSGLDH